MTDTDLRYLHGTNDAQEWAKAFVAVAADLGHRNIDEGWMIGWFANAMMAERDAHHTVDLAAMIDLQLDAQVEAYHRDPRLLEGDEHADFITWNHSAIVRELGEMLDESKWKPWLTTGRGGFYDREAFVKELVDAFHFFMNLLLAAAIPYDDGEQGRPELTPREIASEFFRLYVEKRETNIRRQAEGYDGVKDNGSGSGREVEPMVVERGGIRMTPTTNEPNTWHVTNMAQRDGMRRSAERAWQNSGEQQHIRYPDGSTEHIPPVGDTTETASDDYGNA